ncbi:2-succinyl-5-enolpyruvyl-6-hydroxy-3-cyclohexene-1-carboxylic-acid synthase [Enterococcus durans]|uniref:2-succinyl-5-enolpyruvyl-6-hydroxy-3- cyclohexene-1-carboxylic-acid synthase n=1 Tax=Enterococcus durans TaxID=53345 RepID=UPI00288D27C5|nr:2-succinyl-5-enolpyruvyl-6-hydroxy-3-cyclohexene-1-carboxylic-acid synthase [Enterococcus durans]MDT2837365.1 2-succinyl-5-enolpyruvyl-6-hydroxy-3-cyclohexene-1-carboxylic-acid synthase [Enterococcus durans]
MTTKQEMTKYLLAFINGMKQSGLNKIVISPGSRSTPLALLLHRDPEIETYINVDERSASFFALGLAKGERTVVGLLCTSGTAAANYYPAICEAEASQIPLVVLTADRPPEVQGAGAPQTMEQHNLYGSHVKKFLSLALPEAGSVMRRYSFWQGSELVAIAKEYPAGPIHINLPLREPLLPDLTQTDTTDLVRTDIQLGKSLCFELSELPTWLTKKGLIIVGRELTIEQAQQLIELAEIVDWPIIGDPLTNLSACGKLSKNYLPHAELIFSRTITEQPEVIWQFGNLPVSKNSLLFVEKQEKATYVVIDERAKRQDWLHLGNYYLPVSIPSFLEAVQQVAKKVSFPESSEWSAIWQSYATNAHEVIKEQLASAVFSESSASRKLFQLIEKGESLFLSNSNAIRFIDRLATPTERSFVIYGNRGVNGIDGIVSTAAGIAATQKQRVFLLIGDLALFHDMNGLQMIRQLKLPVTLVVLNNNGGGIFSFLPQNSLTKKDFDPLFATPLNLDLQKVANLYDGYYYQPKSMAEFAKSIEESRKQASWALVEVAGKQEDPVLLWKDILREYGEKDAY